MTTQPDVEPAAPCPNCSAVAEPEQDGQVTYLACSECETEFGYRTRPLEGPACAAGLPVEIREPAGTPVFLGSTIARRPE